MAAPYTAAHQGSNRAWHAFADLGLHLGAFGATFLNFGVPLGPPDLGRLWELLGRSLAALGLRLALCSHLFRISGDLRA